jgi:hypothetical protein
MREETIKRRIDELLANSNGDETKSHELFQGTLSLLVLLYGQSSSQVESLKNNAGSIINSQPPQVAHRHIARLAIGALNNLKGEIEAGVVGSIRKAMTGEVLADFLQLSRAALHEKGDDAKNVASVLAAALFEDTIRRLAAANAIPHNEKLQDVITALKDNGVLQGSQVGIANSYLNFRNNSLHAQWDKVGRESVASVLGFVEQLLVKHFS